MLKKLQKIDQDTNDLIDRVRAYLFSVGIRTTRERAWDVFQNVHRIPYEMMIEKNPKIKYQGQGQHITHKHGSQLMVIKNVGKFELKGVSVTKDKKKKASIKFYPSAEVKAMVEKIEVEE